MPTPPLAPQGGMPLHRRPVSSAVRWVAAAWLAALASVSLLPGCGGGVGSGGTGTGSIASGPITGLGSIFVNGVRFDDSAATVRDDDDNPRSSSELKLGMQVEVQADAIVGSGDSRSAKASAIRVGSEMIGPVASLNSSAASLTVLGQTVYTSGETVFDAALPNGLASVSLGQVLEVHAKFDAAVNGYRATRIEPRAGASAWALRGVVATLDTTARVLRVGTASFTYGSATGTPADLAAGSVVRMLLRTGTDALGRYTVSSFGTAQRTPPDLPQAEFKGFVTRFTSAASFAVNNVAVDASAASFPDGTAGLRLGARVEVEGRIQAGTLVASSVSIENDEVVDRREFEFRGNISAVDTVGRTITVRGETISLARADLRIDNGTLADLVVGRAVEVRAQLTPQRTRLEAVRVVLR
ncbi:MAG: DUF5666 domain-containing protein [Rubrivivax sp.]|nr:DUF5666 domain-containing protein [Rubrivivax sp.]